MMLCRDFQRGQCKFPHIDQGKNAGWEIKLWWAELPPADDIRRQVGMYLGSKRHTWMPQVGFLINVGTLEIKMEEKDSVSV